jgi:hypothetical protein
LLRAGWSERERGEECQSAGAEGCVSNRFQDDFPFVWIVERKAETGESVDGWAESRISKEDASRELHLSEMSRFERILRKLAICLTQVTPRYSMRT